MPLIVVVGGQYGSEGKGKLVAHLSKKAGTYVSAVRCGGPNAGHCVDVGGTRYALRQLPSGVANAQCQLYLAAGMVVHPGILLEEMRDLGVNPERLHIDRNAIVIDESDLSEEELLGLGSRIGSTLSGTGAATARRVLRGRSLVTAADHPDLEARCTNVSHEINLLLDRDYTVIAEGSQGAGLSLYHTPYFPFATSRDTTAAGVLSEVGLAPSLANEVLMVLRTYPIRVAGHSGPLPKEITWTDLRQRSGAPCALEEFTTVTGRLRRIAEFDWGQVEEAVELNRPSGFAIHGLDYLNWANRGATSLDQLSDESFLFIEKLESEFGIPAKYLFTGPRDREIIDRSDGNTSRIPGLPGRVSVT